MNLSTLVLHPLSHNRVWSVVRPLMFRGKMDGLVFTHVPKAAGNSVNAFFEVLRYQCGANVLAFAVAATNAERSCPAILKKHNLNYRHFDIITGHIPFSVARACFGDARYATVLREPVARVLSDFCSQPQHQARPDCGLSLLSDFLTEKADRRPEYAVDNLQVRMLCDDPYFKGPASPTMLAEAKSNLQAYYSLVGVVESFDTFLGELSRLYDVPAPQSWEPVNVSPPYLDRVSSEHRLLISRHNELDSELYSWVKSRSFIAAGQVKKRDNPGEKVIAEPSTITRI